jgi:hypothetical protein
MPNRQNQSGVNTCVQAVVKVSLVFHDLLARLLNFGNPRAANINKHDV